jgi:hypothetical protein
MSLDIVSLHEAIDKWAAEQRAKEQDSSEAVPDIPARELPKDKRLVRTKTSGDVVSLIDEVKKTRQKILGTQGPEIVESLGFTMADVGEATDEELFSYQMGPALYKPVDAPA